MKKSIFAGAALLALALSAHSTELFVNIHSGQAMAQAGKVRISWPRARVDLIM